MPKGKRIQVKTTENGRSSYAAVVDRNGNELERSPLVPSSRAFEAKDMADNYRKVGAWKKS